MKVKFEDILKEFFELDTANVNDILDYFSYKYKLDRKAIEVGYYLGRICAIVDYILPFRDRNYLDLNSLIEDVEKLKKMLRR